MEKKKTIGIAGCGKLAHIVADAWLQGLLPEYDIVAAYSRTFGKAQSLARKLQAGAHNESCRAFEKPEDFLAFQCDFIVETASPAAMRQLAIPALENGSSIVCLSIGALADEEFYEQVRETAKKHGGRVYLASGSIGGFDVLQTVSLMGSAKMTFDTEKGPDSLKNTAVYDEALQSNRRQVFTGNATEAIAMFPTKVNVTVAASLASTGPKNSRVTITSTPGFKGDTHRIEAKNEQVRALVEIYSETAEIAGWSIVRVLRNIVSPIVF